MHLIMRADGRLLHIPGADGVSFESQEFDTPLAAMDRLLAILQVFTAQQLAKPTVGLHIYPSDPGVCLDCDYLVLAVTDRGASFYAASLSDLVRHNLPVPPRQESPAC